MRLLLIRHGDPDYEHDGLTPVGEREAALLVPRMAGETVTEFFVSTMENIDIKPLYTAADIKDAEQIGFMPGIAPNLRGILSMSKLCRGTEGTVIVVR